MRRFAAVLAFLFAATAYSQIIADLPKCWKDCIHNSGYYNCDDLDIPCICRLSNGNFLPDIVTCVKGNCDNQLDSNLLLTPLQLACNLAGTPISSAAIRNAQNAPSAGEYSIQTDTVVVPRTSTTTAYGTSQDTTTKTVTPAPLTRTTTATQISTDDRGRTYYIVVPVTINQGSTVSGQPSTTRARSDTTTTNTLGVASSSASPSSESVASAASSLSSEAAAEKSGSTVSSTSTTTVAVAVTTTTSTNSVAGNTASSTNGSPFNMQSAATKKEGSSWLGLTIGLIAGIVWL
ncbi:hypothetical protein MMC16_003739 [Acarospora aff. strigata]|nr:hypothetical protein [Acarospora aff. strigata]